MCQAAAAHHHGRSSHRFGGVRKNTPPYPCISARNIFHYTRMSLTPLRPRPPNAPLSAPPRAPETDAERRARHLDMLREMAELAMEVARHAAAKATSPDPATADAPDPGLTFARATRAARQAIALETRIAAGDLPPMRAPRPARDPAAPRARPPPHPPPPSPAQSRPRRAQPRRPPPRDRRFNRTRARRRPRSRNRHRRNPGQALQSARPPLRPQPTPRPLPHRPHALHRERSPSAPHQTNPAPRIRAATIRRATQPPSLPPSGVIATFVVGWGALPHPTAATRSYKSTTTRPLGCAWHARINPSLASSPVRPSMQSCSTDPSTSATLHVPHWPDRHEKFTSTPASTARSRMRSEPWQESSTPVFANTTVAAVAEPACDGDGARRDAAEALLLEAGHVEPELLNEPARRLHERHGTAQINGAVAQIRHGPRQQLGRDAADQAGPAPIRWRPAAGEVAAEPGMLTLHQPQFMREDQSSGVRAKCRNRISASGSVSNSQRDIAISGVTPLPPDTNR